MVVLLSASSNRRIVQVEGTWYLAFLKSMLLRHQYYELISQNTETRKVAEICKGNTDPDISFLSIGLFTSELTPPLLLTI